MENATRAQQRLVAKGYPIEIDGDFGPASFAAIMSYVGRKFTVTLLRQQLGQAAAKEFENYSINTPMRIAQALAQQSTETGGFSSLRESLNYSVKGLEVTFSRSRISLSQCKKLGRKAGESSLDIERQAAIGNLVYGGEWGRKNLGNEHPGDGWKYRGRGVLQTTGLYNYASVAKLTKLDVVADPELLEVAGPAMKAGGVYWHTRGCNEFADADDIRGLTKRINGGLNGLADRKAALKRAKEILL